MKQVSTIVPTRRIRLSSPLLRKWWRDQQVLVFIGVVVYAVLWIFKSQLPFAATILFSLCIGDVLLLPEAPAAQTRRRCAVFSGCFGIAHMLEIGNHPGLFRWVPFQPFLR